MAGALKSTSEGRTLILTISNPEHRNAMDPEIYAAGVEALNAAENNPEIRSVILTGEGTMFCAGADLQRLKANRQKPAEVQAQSIEALHSWVDSIRTFPKPVIAAVEGAAAGAGFSLALACDFIVAAENALFVMAHSTIGLSPDGGGSWALARALPRTMVARLLMLGERIPTAQLFSLGLVYAVSPVGQSLRAALQLAEQLNERAPNALASIKDLINEAPSQTLTEQLASELDHCVKNLHHRNAGEGIEAFLQKRKPLYL